VLAADCVWDYVTPPPQNSAAEATFFWKSDASLDTPELQPFQIEVPFVSEVLGAVSEVPAGAWSIAPGIVRPVSRGEVRLTEPDEAVPVTIDGGFLRDEADMATRTHGRHPDWSALLTVPGETCGDNPLDKATAGAHPAVAGSPDARTRPQDTRALDPPCPTNSKRMLPPATACVTIIRRA
jgi:hypothetical protein